MTWFMFIESNFGTLENDLATVSASERHVSICTSYLSWFSAFWITGFEIGVGKGYGLLAATRIQCLWQSGFWENIWKIREN